MISIKKFTELALSFQEAIELPHFENTSFRVNKKIFASLSIKDKRACLKLSLVDQSVFASLAKLAIYPVPNKWGKQGWTFFELDKVKTEMVVDALTTAYCNVAPKRLAKQYLGDE
jgi:predicted DNA-binding protein (MmcQ/YjbR family)